MNLASSSLVDPDGEPLGGSGADAILSIRELDHDTKRRLIRGKWLLYYSHDSLRMIEYLLTHINIYTYIATCIYT